MVIATQEQHSISLEEALFAIGQSSIPILAGGTDFYPALADKPAPATVLDITRIHELRGITQHKSGWSIGAATTWTDVCNAPLPAAFDGLKQAAREVGSIQIQNSGTLVGNLCNASPAADGVPPLLCLNAGVVLATSESRRQLPLSEFILAPRKTALQPAEMVVSIEIPATDENVSSQFYKLGSRRYLVISIVMVSLVMQLDNQGCIADIRIAVGSCSEVAQRLYRLEEALAGHAVDADLLSIITPHMLTELSPIDDVRGSAIYREKAVEHVLKRMMVTPYNSYDE